MFRWDVHLRACEQSRHGPPDLGRMRRRLSCFLMIMCLVKRTNHNQVANEIRETCGHSAQPLRPVDGNESEDWAMTPEVAAQSANGRQILRIEE